MTEYDLRIQIAELGLSLFNRGYSTGGAGNVSVRLPDGNIILSPTNSCLGRLDPATLSLLDPEGKHLSGDAPSKEWGLHLGVYHARPDCGAVVHLHSTHLTALSCLAGLNPDSVIRPFTPYYVMRVGAMPLVPYFKPGDARLAEATAARAAKANALLLANHGSVVLGSTLVEAVNNAEELEETARLYFLLGDRDIRYLTDGEAAELRPAKR